MNFYDFKWILSLFGTSLGVGFLFLPIKAGAGGIYPFFVMVVFGAFMAFFTHWAVYKYCSGAKGDIKEVSQSYFGSKTAYIITSLYFFAFLSACLSYGIGLVNSIMLLFEFLKIPISREIVVFVCISALVGVMCIRGDFVLKVFEIFVFPLCIFIFAFGLYLIKYWDFSAFSYVPSGPQFFKVILFALPLLAFTFQFVAVISTFKQKLEEKYTTSHEKKAKMILFFTFLMLLIFVGFFTFSSLMCIKPDELDLIREKNISALSFFSLKLDNDLLGYCATFIAILALTISFFGHYFAVREGLFEILKKSSKICKISTNDSTLVNFSNFLLYLIILAVVLMNLNILKILEVVVSPIVVILLFFLPLYGFYKVKILNKYKNKIVDIFILFVGIITFCMGLFEVLKDLFFG